ncbi:MAG TPA: DUF296 domain-containing protein, partial [Candidatus Hydrothermia bacterium]|nr:DUF296 domain-containing protein [Candidatus Hydrothermia bacterium]
RRMNMEFKEEANTVVVIMKDGEELQKNLDLLVSTFKFIPMLTVASALGMLKDIKLGFWNGSEYELHEFKGPVELLSISGIITPNTDPSCHFHITIADRDGSASGGHLIEARVYNTLEMVLIKSHIGVKRVPDGNLKKLGLI